MQEIICKCCGANILKPQGRNSLICEFCGSRFVLDEDENVVSEELTQQKVMKWFLEAEKYRKENNKVAEMQALISSIEEDENSEVAWTKLGRAYRESNLLDKALECYEKAKKINPDYGQIYSNIGGVYLVQKNYAEAVPYYEKALSLIEETEIDYPVVLGNYAMAAGCSGDKKKAVELLKKAQKRGYKNVDIVKKSCGITFWDMMR